MGERDIVVVGGSAGGLEALITLVRGLPADFPAALFVVIHYPSSAPSALPAILTRAGSIRAVAAEDGASVTPGRIYVARPGCHLVLRSGRTWLDKGPQENRHRPGIDPLFRSAAKEYGPRVIGVVLSGGQNDGTAGLLTIKSRGGLAVVQDPETALHPAMPRNAIEYGDVDHIVAPEALPRLLTRLVAEPLGAAAGTEHMIGENVMEPAPQGDVAREDRNRQPGVPSTQTCPECHGTLWESEEEGLLKFRCRVGHAYTAEALIGHQSEQLEAALWTALRALEEHQALARRLAGRAARYGHSHTAAVFTEQAMDAEHSASVIREALHGGGSHGESVVERSTIPA